ncbi:TPA: hypothetical protein RUX44_004408 [Aeromonas hydrophila]|uniref:hypothetical protein n=1 Tax=Aeromonas hydrophila TaxID=644 RepID=UPI0028D97CC6|nr:hypothetical protein [Aeromonas hydrophila]HDZ8916013.1 hypothetical protein [Aeromonas hydrophila]
MQKFKMNEAYLPIMTLTYFFVLMFKYCLESWNNDYKDFISSCLVVVHILSWVWIAYALYISKNKERIFFTLVVLFFIFSFFMAKSQYCYWIITAYPLFIFFSRLDYKSKVKIVFTAQTVVLICFLLILPFSNDLFFIDDRYIRFTGGLDNPNTLSAILLSYYLSMVLFFNIYVGSNRLVFPLLTLFSGMLFYTIMHYTYSRTHIALLILSMALSCLPFLWRFISRKVIVTTIALGIFIQIYFATSFVNGDELSALVNTFTSGRVYQSSRLFIYFFMPGIFYGNDISEYQPIDFFYIKTIFSGGVIYFLILAYILVKFIMKSRDLPSLFYLFFFVMVLTSYTESYYNIVTLNFTVLFIYQMKSELILRAVNNDNRVLNES